jgi:CheY-like chemotaxis protein
MQLGEFTATQKVRAYSCRTIAYGKQVKTDNPKPVVHHRTPRPRTILLVDDNDETRIMTKWFFGNFGYSVDSTKGAEEALALFNPAVHDVIITDNSMQGMTGVEMAHVIKLRSPTTPVLMYTGSVPSDQSCLDLVFQKPTHLSVLEEALRRLLPPG